MTQTPQNAPLGVVSLGLAFVTSWAVGMFILGIAGALFDYGASVITAMSSVYLGFGASFVGVLWGFFDGFTGGVVIA